MHIDVTEHTFTEHTLGRQERLLLERLVRAIEKFHEPGGTVLTPAQEATLTALVPQQAAKMEALHGALLQSVRPLTQ